MDGESITIEHPVPIVVQWKWVVSHHWGLFPPSLPAMPTMPAYHAGLHACHRLRYVVHVDNQPNMHIDDARFNTHVHAIIITCSGAVAVLVASALPRHTAIDTINNSSGKHRQEVFVLGYSPPGKITRVDGSA